MRCNACNRLLPDDVLAMSKEIEGKIIYEDFCSICRSATYSKYNYDVDHEYQHEGIGVYGDFHKILDKSEQSACN